MAIRQQRGANWRGQVPFKTLASAVDMTLAFQAINAGSVEFLVGSITGTVTLNGIPQMIRASDGGIATTATWTAPNVLTVGWSTPSAEGDTWTMPAKDPALRTDTGSFVAPTIVATFAPTPPATWTYGTATVGGDITTVFTTVPSGAPFNLNLPVPTVAGEQYGVAVDAGAGGNVGVYGAGLVLIDTVNAGEKKAFRWDGANWNASTFSF